jgi:hypothetical protein
MATALRASIRSPIAIMPGTPSDADNPSPVPIVVPAILILVVMPLVAVSVVMASVMIWVIPSVVTISRGWRWKKRGDTEYHSKE